MNTKPTIKGLFVNSHIEAVRNKLGAEGIERLERLFGKSVVFGNNQDVRVLDEVKIIEYTLDLLSDVPVPPEERAYEAGKLHFRNFITTSFAKIAFPMFKNNFKTMMLRMKFLAEHIFKGVNFSSKELADKKIEVIMENNDYPIDHFRGLFQEWMSSSGLKGTVKAREAEDDQFIFILEWE